jgi:uncharacterized protein YyaL (SSP411 family)
MQHLDADSEGEEGKFYVWDKKEIEEILGADAAIFCDYYDVSEAGNWEDKNILRVLQDEESFVAERQLDKENFTDLRQRCLQKLLQVRSKRIRPGLDDKIILGWNALIIKAIARAAVVLQDEHYKDLAVKAYDFVLKHFSVSPDNIELQHVWKNGQAKYPAFLDDYAYLIEASLAMYELTFDTDYLIKANVFVRTLTKISAMTTGLFFYYTNHGQDDVITRKKELYDGATPSGNAVLWHTTFTNYLSFLTKRLAPAGQKIWSLGLADAIIKYPTSFGNMGLVACRKK